MGALARSSASILFPNCPGRTGAFLFGSVAPSGIIDAARSRYYLPWTPTNLLAIVHPDTCVELRKIWLKSMAYATALGE